MRMSRACNPRRRLAEAQQLDARVDATVESDVVFRGAKCISGKYALVVVEAQQWQAIGEAEARQEMTLKFRCSVTLCKGSTRQYDIVHTVRLDGDGASRAVVAARARELVQRLTFEACGDSDGGDAETLALGNDIGTI